MALAPRRAAQRAGRATGGPAAPARTRVVLADVAPGARSPRPHCAPSWPSRPGSARRWSAAWCGPSSALALRLAVVVAIGLGGAAAAVRGRAGGRPAQGRSASTCRGCCSAWPPSRSCSPSAGRTSASPSATSRTSPTWSGGRSAEWTTRTPSRRSCAVTLVTVAIGVYGLRLARTTSDFLVASRMVSPTWNAAAIGGEYLSAASLPRRRRADPQVRRRRALVPGRVRRRLPGAAAVRRRAAAPLRRVHPARLLRGAAAARAGCASSPPRSWCSSAGSTWCRSCRAPG